MADETKTNATPETLGDLPSPEQPSQLRDTTRAEKEKIVCLKLSELFPFKGHPLRGVG